MGGIKFMTEKDLKLISRFDYQAINNGLDGWYANHGYREIFEFVTILEKRNNELDQKVARIFKAALIANIEYDRHYSAKGRIPEIDKIIDQAKNDIDNLTKEYNKIATQFMESYGLESYYTKSF